MSVQQQRLRRDARTNLPPPIIDETPTLRLGSMPETVRAQDRKPVAVASASANAVKFPECGPESLSAEELDALDRIPRRHWPLFVFTAIVAIAALCAATWPKTRVLIDRIAMMPIASGLQEQVIEPLNAAAVNQAPAEIPTTANSAVEIVPDRPPPTPPLQVEAGPTERANAEIPKWPGRSLSMRRSHSIPLRGYAWSSTANALVPIEPPEPADRESSVVTPSKE